MKYVSLPNEILIPEIKKLIDEGHNTIIRVRGYSMRPFLEDKRDKVVLAPIDHDTIQIGDVVLAEIRPNLYVLHRVIKRKEHQLILRGDGNVYGKENCTAENVIAKAIGFYRKGRTKEDSISSIKWRLYSALWPSNTFVRRILLALYRLWKRIFPYRKTEKY